MAHARSPFSKPANPPQPIQIQEVNGTANFPGYPVVAATPSSPGLHIDGLISCATGRKETNKAALHGELVYTSDLLGNIGEA